MSLMRIITVSAVKRFQFLVIFSLIITIPFYCIRVQFSSTNNDKGHVLEYRPPKSAEETDNTRNIDHISTPVVNISADPAILGVTGSSIPTITGNSKPKITPNIDRNQLNVPPTQSISSTPSVARTQGMNTAPHVTRSQSRNPTLSVEPLQSRNPTLRVEPHQSRKPTLSVEPPQSRNPTLRVEPPQSRHPTLSVEPHQSRNPTLSAGAHHQSPILFNQDIYTQPTLDLVSKHASFAYTRLNKVILLWNSFFTLPDFGLGMGTTMFKETKCPYRCVLTADRESLSTADSVLVHAFHLTKDLFNATIPKRMTDKQIFVFFLLENPHRSYPGLMNLDYKNLFNLTFSYLKDPRTDIYSPYGSFSKRNIVDESLVPSLDALKKKTKLVAWLLSNCKAPSARYEYAELLGEHVQIDIFGKCGNDSCPKSERCVEILDRDYLFYLAFENGYCRDYITEKAFRTLGATNMVPIVLGGANYTRHMPAHSYIDIRDYSSPMELARYLLHLQENLLEYREYLVWKSTYQIETVRTIRRAALCKLCTILNNQSYTYKREFEPLEYWNPDDCLHGDDEREALGIF